MYQKTIINDMEEIYSTNCDWKSLNDSTILLSGPYGMLASYIVYLVCFLVECKKYKIKLIAVGRSRKKFNLKFKDIHIEDKEYISFIESDLCKKLIIDEKIDYIVHAASLASPQYYSVCPVDVLKPNVVGTYHLLNCAVEHHAKGFLLFSTGDIYGRVEKDGKVTELDYGVTDTLDIHSCYGESKRMAETMCMSFFRQYNVPIKIARIWHTYSPTMDLENAPRVFASFAKNVVKGQDIEMKSDGKAKRSFCYITDAVAGFFKILLECPAGEAFNVCNEDEFVSIGELAERVACLSEQNIIKVVRKERGKDEHYTENDFQKDREVCPSSEKLQRLGWEHRVSIEEGFKRVIAYNTKENNK